MKNDKIKDDIRNLLLSKGYVVSNQSTRILTKIREMEIPDAETGYIRILETKIKYRFGKNNLQKFSDGIKRYSVPFSRIEIKEGKIKKKTENIEV